MILLTVVSVMMAVVMAVVMIRVMVVCVVGGFGIRFWRYVIPWTDTSRRIRGASNIVSYITKREAPLLPSYMLKQK